MEIVSKLVKIPRLALALGFFDGVHLGHRAVIKKTVQFAKESGVKSGVVTFKEHPLVYLKGISPKYICSRKDTYNEIEKLGIDYVIELDFPQFANMSAEEYINNVLVEYFSPVAIFTGFNHYFGADKSGNVEFLASFKAGGFQYFPISACKLENQVVSSSLIRENISNGLIENANLMLGQEFFINGLVVYGNQIGRTIGFPTANVEWDSQIIEPSFGVYKTEVVLSNGENYLGVANFGVRPTVSKELKSRLEVHLIGFDGDLYGQNLKIKFLKKIREEKKFSSIDELKAQIEKDIIIE